MPTSAQVSIGDVLDQLRDEFPDITISKIRFLESQGLIDPERTPSGYRKFSPADVERLRFILRQQREHFLPLKVIKERLDQLDQGVPAETFDAPVRAVEAETEAPKPRRRKAPAAEPLFEMARRAAEDDDAREATSAVRDDEGPDDHRLSQTAVILTRAELAARRRHHRRRARPARGIRARHARRTRRATGCSSTRTRSRSRASRASFMRHGDRGRGTCACTARSPNAKRACSSRCCCRTGASATPKRRPARARRSASSSGLGRQLRTALAAPGRPTFAHGLTCRRRSCSTPTPSPRTSRGSAPRSSGTIPTASCSSAC